MGRAVQYAIKQQLVITRVCCEAVRSASCFLCNKTNMELLHKYKVSRDFNSLTKDKTNT